jgi:hypothetical protein
LAIVSLHQEELRDIKDELAGAHQDTPDFWQASFQVLNLLSKAKFPGVVMVGGGIVLRGTDHQYFDRVGPVLLQGLTSDSTFSNTVIEFDSTTKLRNVTFTNCIFVFPSVSNPPKPLQEIGNALLASDLSRLTITTSS